MSEPFVLRPPGHITELTRRLARWRQRRMAKGLPVGDLARAEAYLEEYRQLTHEYQQLRWEVNR